MANPLSELEDGKRIKMKATTGFFVMWRWITTGIVFVLFLVISTPYTT